MRRPSQSQRPCSSHLWLEEIGSGLGFAALREQWSRLHAASGAGPFLSWDWLYPWWRRVRPEGVPRLLAARDERGELAGLLPLYERREGPGGEARRWGLLGDVWVGSDYLDLLGPAGAGQQLAELFAAALEARLERFDLLELLDLPRGSPLADALLARLAPRAWVAERFPRYVCPLIEIRGTFGEYLRAVGRADNLARRHKWLAAQPGFRIETVERPEQLGPALTEFFRLHELRWEADGGSQGVNTREVRAFHRDAAHHLAESGRLRLYTLWLGSQALASIYAVVDRDRFFFYQSGYDPAWARRSVGLVLLGRTIEDAFGEGRVAYEFLRGQEPYKLEWASSQRQTEGVRIVNRTAAGAAWLAGSELADAAKGVARRVLGEKRWEELRRARRRRGSS